MRTQTSNITNHNNRRDFGRVEVEVKANVNNQVFSNLFFNIYEMSTMFRAFVGTRLLLSFLVMLTTIQPSHSFVPRCPLPSTTPVASRSLTLRYPSKQQQRPSSARFACMSLVSPLFDATTIASSSIQVALTSVSPEPIHTAFSVATFLPQPFWLLMILLPNANITKTIMGGLQIPLLCSLIHLFIVVASLVTGGAEATAPLAEFNQVFDPAGDPQAAFFGMTSHYPNFVAEEWSHVLTWDLFVGRWIWWHSQQQQKENRVWTAPSVLLCNLIGPPGLLLYGAQCALGGVPLVDVSATYIEESEE